MHAGPHMYRPASPLADYVESIGDWRSREVDYWSRALPRGAVTVIFDVGQRQQLHFYAADGKTRLSVAPAFITGSNTASYVSNITAGEPVMAVHFRPGGAFPFFPIPLGDLEDTYVGVDQVWGCDGRDLHERLIETSSAASRIRILEEFLLSRPWLSADRQPGVAAAMAAIRKQPLHPDSRHPRPGGHVHQAADCIVPRRGGLVSQGICAGPSAPGGAAAPQHGPGGRGSRGGRGRLFRSGALRPRL